MGNPRKVNVGTIIFCGSPFHTLAAAILPSTIIGPGKPETLEM